MFNKVFNKRAIEYVRKGVLEQMIDSAKAQMDADTLIQRKDMATAVKQYNMGAIDIVHTDDVKTATLGVVKQGENVFLADSYASQVMVKTENIKKSYDNFVDSYITVKGSEEVWNEIEGKNIFVNFTTGDIYVNTTATKKDKNGVERPAMLNLRSGNLNFKHSLNLNKMKEFKYLFSTSGHVKDGTAIFSNVELGTAKDIINKYIPGMMDEAADIMDQEEAVKFAARPGLAWTKGLIIARFYNIVKVKGDFDNAIWNGKSRNTGDGAIIMRASVAMRLFNLKSQAEAVSLSLQARFYGVFKMQIIVVQDEMFKAYLEEYKAKRQIQVYGDIDKCEFIIDDNAQKAKINVDNGFLLTMMSIAKFTEGKMSKQMIESLVMAAVETGRLEELKAFLLEHATKQIVEVAKDAMNTEHKEYKMEKNRTANGDEKAPYSIDVLNALKPTNPIAAGIRMDDSVSSMAKMIDKMAIKLKNSNGSSQIYNGVVCTDIAAFIGKNIIPAGAIVVGKVTKELSRLKAKYGVDSEEYKTYKKQHSHASFFKYPKMYFNEFYKGRVLDLEELGELIDAMDITDAMKRHFKFYFANMSDATIMFPADRAVFELLAGMDIDFDKVVAVFNGFVNELLDGRQENLFISSKVVGQSPVAAVANTNNAFDMFDNAVEATPSISKEKTFKPKEEGFFQSVFLIQLKGEGKIGVITFYNNKVVALRSEVLIGNNVQALYFAKECIGSTKGLDRKYNVSRNIIDPAYVDLMIEEMKEVVWNNENLAAFLADCSKVFRLYQESAIDAAKTGIYLTVKLTCRTIVIDSLLRVSRKNVEEENVEEIEVELEDGSIEKRQVVTTVSVPKVVREEYKKKTIKFFKKVGNKVVEYRKPMETKNLSDVIGKIQDQLIEVVNIKVKELYNNNQELFAYTSEEAQSMKEELTVALKSNKEVVKDLFVIKDLYHDVVRRYVEERQGLYAKKLADDVLEAKLEVIRDAHKENVDKLANSARRVIARYNGSEYACGALALAVTTTSKASGKYTVNKNNRSRFAYNVLPEHALAFLVGGSKINAVGTVLQTGAEEDGIVNLDNGMTPNGLIIKERYTGEALLENGKISAVIDMHKEIELNDKEFTVVVPAKGNEFVIEQMTRNSAIAVHDGGLVFYKDENSDAEQMKKQVFFDAELNDGDEFYINGSQVVELWMKKMKDGRAVNVQVECYMLSVEAAV